MDNRNEVLPDVGQGGGGYQYRGKTYAFRQPELNVIFLFMHINVVHDKSLGHKKCQIL